jgi:hypothetical protein
VIGLEDLCSSHEQAYLFPSNLLFNMHHLLPKNNSSMDCMLMLCLTLLILLISLLSKFETDSY